MHPQMGAWPSAAEQVAYTAGLQAQLQPAIKLEGQAAAGTQAAAAGLLAGIALQVEYSSSADDSDSNDEQEVDVQGLMASLG